MARWEFVASVDRGSGTPLYEQIVHLIAREITRGRLRPGDRLPGSRTLARMLGVQRLTVVAALDELAAEGWIVTRPASGTFVAPERPDRRARRFATTLTLRAAVPSTMPLDLADAPPPDPVPDLPAGTLWFAGSRPDVRLLPFDLIGRAYRRALREQGAALLTYAQPDGHPRLRAALADMLSATRGLAADASSIVVTRGSQMALALIARALIRPGDIVIVEALGYRAAWESFRLAGATILPIAVDGDGLRTDDLAACLDSGLTPPVRAVYVTPHHQFPTTVTLTAARRRQLLDLAARHRFAIVEDDYDHEFHYDGRPVLPLASVDQSGLVIYVGTLSKVLAPGLRLGYIVAPRPLVERVAAHRSFMDTQGDQVVELAVAQLLEDGALQRHVQRVRRTYGRRRDALAAALRARLRDRLTFIVPSGGIALWVTMSPPANDIEAWAARARQHGVLFDTARQFDLAQRTAPSARLGFAALDEAEIAEAVSRLAAAWPA